MQSRDSELLQPPVRILLVLIFGASLASVVFILDFVEYPFEIPGILVFARMLYAHDLAGAAAVMAIALAALLPGTRGIALGMVETLGRNPWRVAGAAFVALCTGHFLVAHGHAFAGDEHIAVLQSRIFAAARLSGALPPDLVEWLVPVWYQARWLMYSTETGAIASMYFPAFALLLAPFSLLGIPWALNPLLAALSLVLMARLAAHLTGQPQAAGWALLFALGSPGFTAMSMSYFSMPAHLFLNLLFAWLVLSQSLPKLFLAGLIGALALNLHQPVPHLLFAAPWVLWLFVQSRPRRKVFVLAAGYLPLGLLLGLGWAIHLRSILGPIWQAPFHPDNEWLNHLGNTFWFWHMRTKFVFNVEGSYVYAARATDLVRLWTWSAPALPLLALLGLWRGWGNVGLRLLGLSFVITFVGYFNVRFDQGSGWGARYLHPPFGALPILAAAAMTLPAAARFTGPLRSYVASLAFLGLAALTPLRWAQVHTFVDAHLAQRPEFVPGARQLVVIALDAERYTQDLMQNDPFLRDPVIFLARQRCPPSAVSLSECMFAEDLIRKRFPDARLLRVDERGQLWQRP